MSEIAPPEADGLYANIPMAAYHAWPGASRSVLKKLKRSPAHALVADERDSDALRVGNLVHTLLLEPGSFGKFARYEKKDRRIKENKEQYAELCASFGEENLVDSVTYDKIDSIARSVLAVPKARAIIEAASCTEGSVWWRGENGVPRKARPDIYCEGLALAADLKTTSDASPGFFSRQIYNYAYHIQAFHSMDGLNAIGKPCQEFVFIVVESAPPYGCALYRFTMEALTAAKVERNRLLKKYDECFLSGAWPCYPQDIQDIGLPTWAINQINEETIDE